MMHLHRKKYDFFDDPIIEHSWVQEGREQVYLTNYEYSVLCKEYEGSFVWTLLVQTVLMPVGFQICAGDITGTVNYSPEWALMVGGHLQTLTLPLLRDFLSWNPKYLKQNRKLRRMPKGMPRTLEWCQNLPAHWNSWPWLKENLAEAHADLTSAFCWHNSTKSDSDTFFYSRYSMCTHVRETETGREERPHRIWPGHGLPPLPQPSDIEQLHMCLACSRLTWLGMWTGHHVGSSTTAPRGWPIPWCGDVWNRKGVAMWSNGRGLLREQMTPRAGKKEKSKGRQKGFHNTAGWESGKTNSFMSVSSRWGRWCSSVA